MGLLDAPRGGSGRTSRRAFLQVGYSGLLGLSLPGLLAARASATDGRGAGQPVGRARSVIVILLSGGLGQHDSFDMKPEAPEAMRGEFKPIDTAVPGIADLRAPAGPGRAGGHGWRSSGRWPIPRGTTCWRSTGS